MLILTDDLYQKNDLDLLKNGIFDCMRTSSLIGIGIGFYPLKIKELFVQSIYIKNPQRLFTGISKIILNLMKNILQKWTI